MSSESFPFGSDTLSVPLFLVSDENDPAYRAWRAEHPDAFAAGTWTRPAPARRTMPPDVSRSHRTDIDPAAAVSTRDLVARSNRPDAARSRWTDIDPAATVSTRDLVAQSNLSTQEFMQIADASRAGTLAPGSPEHHQPHDTPHPGLPQTHRPPAAHGSAPEDYPKQLTDAEFKQRNIDDLAAIMFNEARGRGELGMTAVGSTVWNRMLSNHVSSVRSVWGGYKHDPVDRNNKEIGRFDQARRIAQGILNGTTTDPTGGADHYYSPNRMP